MQPYKSITCYNCHHLAMNGASPVCEIILLPFSTCLPEIGAILLLHLQLIPLLVKGVSLLFEVFVVVVFFHFGISVLILVFWSADAFDTQLLGSNGPFLKLSHALFAMSFGGQCK